MGIFTNQHYKKRCLFLLLGSNFNLQTNSIQLNVYFSSDPASYEDVIHRRQHSTSRSKARSSSATRNGELNRSSTPRSSSKRKQHGNDVRASCKRHGESSKKEGQHQSLSRDSGIDERRESLSLTCSNCHQSTGGSSW